MNSTDYFLMENGFTFNTLYAASNKTCITLSAESFRGNYLISVYCLESSSENCNIKIRVSTTGSSAYQIQVSILLLAMLLIVALLF